MGPENFLPHTPAEDYRILDRVDVAEQERNAALRDRAQEKELEEKDRAATEASAADKKDTSL